MFLEWKILSWMLEEKNEELFKMCYVCKYVHSVAYIQISLFGRGGGLVLMSEKKGHYFVSLTNGKKVYKFQ